MVLATGSRHREIVLPGRDLAGVLPLRTLADADAMRERLEAAGHVVVVGGGFIGLEEGHRFGERLRDHGGSNCPARG